MQNALTPDKFLSGQEVDELLQRLEQHKYERDSVLLRTLIFSGARGCEVLELMPKSLIKNDLVIKGRKGSNNRVVPLAPAFARELREYCERNSIRAEDRIWPISTRTLRWVWDKWRRVRKGAHSARHTVGVRLYRNCHDIKAVQSQLGHKNISNTMIYLDYVDGAESLRKKSYGMWKRGNE
jgi:integrase